MGSLMVALACLACRRRAVEYLCPRHLVTLMTGETIDCMHPYGIVEQAINNLQFGTSSNSSFDCVPQADVEGFKLLDQSAWPYLR
jgi:hypothetical protein